VIPVAPMGRSTMSGTTISGSTTVGVSLTTPSQNPLMITTTGGIAVPDGYAIYGSDAATWTITNAGVVSIANADTGGGLKLEGGAVVTNTATGTIAGGRVDMLLYGLTSSVANYGVVGNPATYLGVYDFNGGIVTNFAFGTIEAGGQGVTFRESLGSVVNSGLIAGNGFAGIRLADGGFVTNAASGMITGGESGIVVGNAAATVTNAGLIAAGAFGVYFSAGGTLTNTTGTITGNDGFIARYVAADVTNQGFIGGTNVGIYLAAGGTLVNAGTISGGSSVAVNFAGTGLSLLQIDPGAVFSGVVEANAGGGGNTLYLAAGSGTGTISGLGSQYTGFGTVDVGIGASWQLTGYNNLNEGSTLTNDGVLSLSNAVLTDTGGVVNNGAISLDPSTMTLAGLTGTGLDTIIDTSTLTVTGEVSAGQTIIFSGSGGDFGIGDLAAMAGTISGWGTTGTIDLSSETYGAVTNVTITTGNVLQVTDTNGIYNLQLDPTQSFSGLFAHQSQDSTGDTELTVNDVPCFLRGTAILTPRGEVAVEHLAAGDAIVTAGGAHRQLVWIGTGQVLVNPGRRTTATPIIVRKSALAANVPNRDLRITKGHSLYLDGVLIPAEFLINHRSVLWDDTARVVTIYHLELDAHDVLLANGAPAESYRDDGNRWLFQNANTGWDLPPKPPCAPVLTGGPIVDTIWRRLLDRSGPRPGVPLTEDPDLHVLAGGHLIKGRRTAEATYLFDLPAHPGELRIISRTGSPAEMGLSRDFRQLGVAVRQITLWQGAHLTMLEASDPRLQQGFHDYEPDNGCRWTDGDATLPTTLLAGFDRPTELTLSLGGRMRYPDYGVSRLSLAG
jgi:hypothetical protein